MSAVSGPVHDVTSEIASKSRISAEFVDPRELIGGLFSRLGFPRNGEYNEVSIGQFFTVFCPEPGLSSADGYAWLYMEWAAQDGDVLVAVGRKLEDDGPIIIEACALAEPSETGFHFKIAGAVTDDGSSIKVLGELSEKEFLSKASGFSNDTRDRSFVYADLLEALEADATTEEGGGSDGVAEDFVADEDSELADEATDHSDPY